MFILGPVFWWLDPFHVCILPVHDTCTKNGISSTLDSRGAKHFSSRLRHTGPAHKSAGLGMGTCPTSPHVLCQPGKGLWLFPLRYPVEGASRIWSRRSPATGWSVSVLSERDFASHYRRYIRGPVKILGWHNKSVILVLTQIQFHPLAVHYMPPTLFH